MFDDVKRDRYPTVTVGASVDVRDQVIPGFTQEPIRTDSYRVGFDAFWELDVFGRVRSAVRAAAATAESYGAALDDVRVSVAAEVARNYFELRGLQQQLAVLDRSLANQRETLRLTELRRDAGFGEEQDVASAAARVAAIESGMPPLRAALAARGHRLAVLVGVRPGDLGVDLAPRAYPVLAKALPLGEPASLLRRRPDVRAAERRLAATAARQGVAAAELFPRITVTGVLGLLAGRGNVFASGDSLAWAVTPALSWAAFDLGSAQARLRGAEAGTRESLAAYEQTVLLALEETENALVALSRAAATPGEAGGSGAGELARGQHRARQVSRGRGRLSRLAGRRTHRAAGRGVGRPGRGRHLHGGGGSLQGTGRHSAVGAGVFRSVDDALTSAAIGARGINAYTIVGCPS